ncbi:MAG: ribonuclease R, partial [Planctomycetes bacterium]|nr:ribonuclease R [Planctomycetota bacterium]
MEEQILAVLARKTYQPLKPKALARKLGVPGADYGRFRQALRTLVKQKRVEIGKNHTVRPAPPHGTVTGVYRGSSGGPGSVRPHVLDGTVGPEVHIPDGRALDAVTGDSVLVRITRKPSRPDLHPRGEIQQVLERATRQFVGTYFEREGQGLVRVDGTVFSHSIFVGDPGAKGVRRGDKVVIEMLRFPTPEDRGEGVLTEVLGPHGKPGVDTLSIIRAFGLPDEFPGDVLEEAREQAAGFHEKDLDGREDFTHEVVITIDPAEARDFDDAVSLVQDPRSRHWLLGVHIADVAHFVPAGGVLDREAQKRGTSVYLPQRVLPMFPEVISNGVASLQQNKLRYVKSALIDFTPAGQKTTARFHNGAIRVRKRFTYEQVSALLEDPEGPAGQGIDPEVRALVLRMRELAMLLRKRRLKRGALELEMPEPELEYDAQGRVTGAHFAKHDVSHQIIEEFMLAANEAVAEHLAELGVPFLRRVHPAPEPSKLKAFAEFARILGYKIERETDRFALQRVLEKSAGKPDVHAVHYALLRSLKQAVYSPEEEGHYALASTNYCHFTSPIRRYPDLTVHRLLGRWLRTGRAGSDETELAALGEHCSKMERRADIAERELIKLKMLTYLNDRLGLELDAVITGVADYGFWAQPESLPVEGLVHISTLAEDYYYFEEESHSLLGRRTQSRYRL